MSESWTPTDPDIPCRMPFDSLRHIFIFTGDKGQDVLSSIIFMGVLQDAAERQLASILGHKPMDVIAESDVGSLIELTGSVPDSAFTSISNLLASLNPTLGVKITEGTAKVCIRNFYNEKTNKRGAIFLIYDKSMAVPAESTDTPVETSRPWWKLW